MTKKHPFRSLCFLVGILICSVALSQAQEAGLSLGERMQLQSALKTVRNDPRMVAARKNLEEAQGSEAKSASMQSLVRLRHDLLLKEDPALTTPKYQAVMAKIDAAPVQ